LQTILEESNKTGKPLASFTEQYLNDSTEIKIVISPADTIPGIAKRIGRRRK